MTTPGGGGNEIEFITRLVPAGDEAAVLREIGEQGYQGLVEALSRRGIPLPEIDAGAFEASFNRVLEALQQRVSALEQTQTAAAERVGQAWREAYAQATAPLAGAARPEESLQASMRGGAVPLGQLQSYQELMAVQERLNFTQATLTESSSVAEQHMEREAQAAESLQARIMGLTEAERSLEVATLRLNQAMETGTLEQRLQALNRFQAAQRRVEDEQTKTATAQQGHGGFIGNLLGGFSTGRGLYHNADMSEANAFQRTQGQAGEFLGAIARYQAAYALIFGVTAGFGALVRAEAQAQDAMIELGHATDTSGRQLEMFTSDLAGVVAAAGGSAASAIQTAARGIYAFGDNLPRNAAGDLTRRGRQQAETIGVESARTAAMAQLLTGAQDVNQAQQELIATTLSYNLSANEQTRVLDAAANAARNYGAGIDQLLQGLPGLAETANAAGLSIEQVSNIMAVAITRSNQTGTGVASLLNRAIGSINERPDTRPLLAGMGVDTSGTAGQVLLSLTHHWKDLSDAQKQAAMTALGGHEVARALRPVLQQGDRLLQNNAKSYENAGYATEKYYQRLNTLAGMLRQIGGDFQRFGHDLSDSGALDIFGVMLKSAHPLLEALDDVFRLFDLFPTQVRHTLVPLLEIYAVLRFIGGLLARNAATQAVETAETEGEAAARSAGGVGGFLSRILPAGTGRHRLETTVAEDAAQAEKVGARAAFGALSDALIGPTGAVIGLLALAGATASVVSAYEHEQQARRQAADAEQQFRSATTADSLRAAAEALGSAAVEQQHANSGFGGMFVASASDRARPDALRAQAAYATSQANAIEQEQERLAQSTRNVAEYFGATSNAADDLARGLDAMANAGVPAVRQLELFTAALRGIGQPGGPGGGGDPTKPGVYGTQTVVAGLVDAVAKALGSARVGASDMTQTQVHAYQDTFRPHHWYDWINPFGGGSIGGVAQQEDMTAAASWTRNQLANIDPSKVRDAINNTLKSRGVGALDIIDAATQKQIADQVISALGLDNVLKGKSRDDLEQQIRSALSSQFQATLTGGGAVSQMSEAEFQQFITGVDSTGKATQAGSLQQRLQALAGTDDPRAIDPALARLRAQTTALQTFVAEAKAAGFGGAGLAELMQMLHQSQHDLAQAAIAHLERLRQAAVAQAGGNTIAVARANASYVLREVRVAERQGDMGELLSVLNSADQATLDSVRKSLELELRTAEAAYNAAMATYEEAMKEWSALPMGLRRANPDALPMPQAPDNAKVKAARDALNQFKNVLAIATPAGSGGAADDPNAARLAAQAVSGDPVSEARAQLAAATYTLQHAKANTSDYWNALKAYHDAQRALTEAIASQRQAEESAQARPGNQLSAAVAAVNAARTNLNAQIRDTAAWWQAWQQLREAQYQASVAALEHAHEQRLTHLDQTDPVAMAREEVRQAQARLHYDKRHGTGDIATDTANLQAAQARAQAAAFDQRLHDVQVAHDLGEMSDAAYLRYLEHQRARLEAIHHKTRQQIEELQQIDQALKAAADQMQGQWNIGDIRIPTPYEARRYIETSNRGLTYSGAPQTTQNTYDIKINGADTAAVRALLISLLGPSVVQATSTTTRKV